MEPIALVCAVELEAAPLLRRMRSVETLSIGGRSAWRGRLAERDVLVVPCGMGKTNAAQAITALLEGHRVRGIVGFGVGGAYPGSGLLPGDVALASAEHYGDEGVETPTGWISCEGIGIPLLRRGSTDYFNELPVDHGSIPAIRAALGDPVCGAFVTVSCCSGTTARGEQLARRFDGVCETMEGAAYAHVAAHYGVPYLEVRGISNLVVDRDRSGWKLQEAAEAAGSAAATIAQLWSPVDSPLSGEAA